MGISFELLDRLHGYGLLNAGSNVLDIGSSNLYGAESGQVRDFVHRYHPDRNGAAFEAFAERIAKGSGYDLEKGGLNESFVGELLEYCGVDYLSFDIADGYRTEIFDLNSRCLDDRHRGAFDLILNIGTTEHVLNQYNCFEVLHDAARTGGRIMHQLPVSGFTDHGYFVYTSRFFFDLAGYNNYEIEHIWYNEPPGEDDIYASARAYKSYFPQLAGYTDAAPINVPNCALTIIYRKKRDAPFVPCMETSTSVGEISRNGAGSAESSNVAFTALRQCLPGKIMSWLRGPRKT